MKSFLVALMPALIPIVLSLVFILVLRAVCIRVQRPREQRGDTYTPLSPTLQWMNTAGSILLATNQDNFRYMAGIYYPGNENKPELVDSIKRSLWDYWGIQGHESVMDAMTRLVRSGMRVWYGEEMGKLENIYRGYSEEELIEVAKQENPKADEDSFLPKMMMAYRRYAKDVLKAIEDVYETSLFQSIVLQIQKALKDALDALPEDYAKLRKEYRHSAILPQEFASDFMEY